MSMIKHGTRELQININKQLVCEIGRRLGRSGGKLILMFITAALYFCMLFETEPTSLGWLRVPCILPHLLQSSRTDCGVIELSLKSVTGAFSNFEQRVIFKLIIFRFPPEHYGKLTCLSLLMGVIFGALQYPLSILTERKFGNNPFWVCSSQFFFLSFLCRGMSMP